MLWLPQIPIACKRLVPKFLFTIRVWLRSINIPPSLCLLLKRLCKAWLTCPSVLSLLTLPLSCSAQDPPHRKPCCSSGSALGRGQPYQLWKHCLPLDFYFNLQILGPTAKGANAQIAWAWSSEWQGLGWPFHINAMPQTSPLARGHRKKGRWGYGLLIQDHGLYKWLVIIWH
jgi:hypothetical protein